MSRTAAMQIIRLGPEDAARFRELRLEGLRAHPEAFGASWEEEAAKPPEWFAELLTKNLVFAGSAAGAALSGVVGLQIPEREKLRHKALLWGMFVQAEHRGTGLAQRLMGRAIEDAASLVEEVKLTVATSNTVAMRFYARAGFVQYGLEPRALKLADAYHDEMLMVMRLRPEK